jgi:hypothetical protein
MFRRPAKERYPQPDKSSQHHPISLRLVLILYSHLRLSPKWSFASGALNKMLYSMRATRTTYLILGHLNNFW